MTTTDAHAPDSTDVLVPSPSSWTWNSQAPPPLSGQVRTDSRDWIAAKQLHIDRRNELGTDVSADLAALKAGDVIRLEHQTDATRYARYTLSAAGTRVVDAYQFSVTYVTGAGVIPNSGTRVTVELLAVASNSVAWSITPAREPDRYWVVAACVHGRQAELMAAGGARQPVPRALIPTVSANLRRRTGCQCDVLQPTLP